MPQRLQGLSQRANLLYYVIINFLINSCIHYITFKMRNNVKLASILSCN